MIKMMKLNKEKKDIMIEEIKNYFANERDEDLGDLASSLILDFFIEKLGPEMYNQGIQDAKQYMEERVMDMLELEKF
ncbi:MAG TPA: DUF2164 domain-containing protein [Epulopiscium sp.]|nr:DUF2164 domain-containing protein [Candidatus Epulonipiscium sp.]